MGRRIRVVREEERGEDGEEKIDRKEIKVIMKRLKEGKAAGGDGIPNEVWKYGGKEMESSIWKLCNRNHK